MDKNEQVRRKGPIVIVSICVALILLAVFAFLYARTTPYYSLYMLKKAIVSRDAREVLRYLDTDSILDNMAKDVFTRMDKKEPPSNKFEQHMRAAGKDLAAQLLPQLKAQMGESITNLLLSYNDEQLFGNLRRATVFALSVTTRGNTAEVRQRGKDRISFTMARSPEGHWRITSFNPEELKLLGK
ncbi:MAG: hypothetical protein A4E60_02842 [Syntrophorhabdus sp. PtaB.Bin047]|nr:MAG: hypothetical protein A4E60_02842 [Syntrophorhabdus sp. PtaB.Bin047]